MGLNEFLDWNFGADGEAQLIAKLTAGADPNQIDGPLSETALHVATRRRRLKAAEILLDHGAYIDARNAGGKTAYAHAIRRSFDEVVRLLKDRGANTDLTPADQLADAIAHSRLDDARAILCQHPEAARTGNSEEDRLLADIAGRNQVEPVRLLIEAGADLSARGLDDGTALHAAAWFGQPQNARLLIDAGAPLDVFDAAHQSSPLGWAVHGSRYSGGAEERQDVYVELVKMLLDAGSSLEYPNDPGDGYLKRLRNDASPLVREVLPQ